MVANSHEPNHSINQDTKHFKCIGFYSRNGDYSALYHFVLETLLTKRKAWGVICYAEDPLNRCAIGQSEFYTARGFGHGMLINSELKTFILCWK